MTPAGTLLYAYRYPDPSTTHLPPGVGQLRLRTSRVTRRWTAWWRWADDSTWLQIPKQLLDLLPTCGTERQLRDLFKTSAPGVGSGTGAEDGRRGPRVLRGRPTPAPANVATRPAMPPVTRAGRDHERPPAVSEAAGEWAGVSATPSPAQRPRGLTADGSPAAVAREVAW